MLSLCHYVKYIIAKREATRVDPGALMTNSHSRLFVERPIQGDGASPGKTRPARSVTVNLAESPLGWLLARNHISRRQYDAGECLRADWERGPAAAVGNRSRVPNRAMGSTSTGR